MRDVEAYGRIIEEFITRMTSPDMGQFKLEVPTFRIILKTSQKDRPILNKLEITDDGELRNIMDDTLESLEGMSHYFSKCMEFFGSLVGDELSKDIVMRTMEEPVSEIKLSIRNPERITAKKERQKALDLRGTAFLIQTSMPRYLTRQVNLGPDVPGGPGQKRGPDRRRAQAALPKKETPAPIPPPYSRRTPPPEAAHEAESPFREGQFGL